MIDSLVGWVGMVVGGMVATVVVGGLGCVVIPEPVLVFEPQAANRKRRQLTSRRVKGDFW